VDLPNEKIGNDNGNQVQAVNNNVRQALDEYFSR